jgi:putative membrane-bound dehydrogenase-like protein
MRLVATLLASSFVASLAHAAAPRVLLDGAKLELIAREPDVVTPIGMAFDQQGRLLVVESHTHQRPADYAGPKGDRIRMLSDSDGDGRLDRWSTFAEGFQQAMNVCARPDGGVYLVTRRDVRLLEDTDDDGVSDKEMMILRLETEQNYPHNGLSGITVVPFEAHGPRLAIGLGENFGGEYKLIGSDGTTLSGSDGAGAIFTCKLDGSHALRLATGFWNPFSLCTAHGRLFCVDNDPDASPPCRLIDVDYMADYGFRFHYGRAGVHPLQAWNGELPGTSGMVCGVGEAPTAIVSHRGWLWVTSWGDHRIERYELNADAAHKLQAKLRIAVQGDADFRPTGMVVAPDGSLYFCDWVDRSYPVHGKGRIWRLTLPDGEAPSSREVEGYTLDVGFHDEYAADLALLRAVTTLASIVDRPALPLPKVLRELRWFKRDGAIDPAAPPDERLGGYGAKPFDLAVELALRHRDPDVRLFAVRWIADERLTKYRDEVADLLDGEIPNERYFLAVIAALEWLDGDASPRSGGISDGLLRRELANENRSPALKAISLRLISPEHPWLTIERLRGFLASDSEELQREVVQTLAMQTRPERFAVLAEIASDAARDPGMRSDAVAGLAADIANQEALLTTLAEGDEPTVGREAGRVLRLNRKRVEAVGGMPAVTDLDAWNALLGDGGDVGSGRRLFFMSGGPQCAACHQHSGRGARVGPDLTQLGAQQSRERVIASILQPSQEIAPHYQAWELHTSDGLTRVGLRLPKGGDDGVEPYADSTGRRFELRSEEIELRSPAEASIMPEGLSASLTVEDLRDLVAFLAAKK